MAKDKIINPVKDFAKTAVSKSAIVGGAKQTAQIDQAASKQVLNGEEKKILLVKAGDKIPFQIDLENAETWVDGNNLHIKQKGQPEITLVDFIAKDGQSQFKEIPVNDGMLPAKELLALLEQVGKIHTASGDTAPSHSGAAFARMEEKSISISEKIEDVRPNLAGAYVPVTSGSSAYVPPASPVMARGGDNGNGPGDNGNGPGDNGNGPGDNGNGPGDNGNGPGDNGNGPGDNGNGPGDNGNGPGNPPADALFNDNANTVDFNNLDPDSYEAGTQFEAGAGNDHVVLANTLSAAAAHGFDIDPVFDAGDGDDTVIGGDLDDQVLGGAGNDTLMGGNGNDILQGEDGDDTIDGGNGDDLLYGDAGNDTINGGAGIDIIDGGEGNDIIAGGLGEDVIYGGAGADQFRYGALADGGDIIRDFEVGSDKIVLNGVLQGFDSSSNSYDFIRISDVAATANSAAHLLIEVFANGAWTAFLQLEGVTAAQFNWSDIVANGVTVQPPVEPVPPTDLFDAGDNTVNFNNVSASSYIAGTQYNAGDGNDNVTLANTQNSANAHGFGNGEAFDAGAGDDVVNGGALNDYVFGGAGNDTLNGNGGNDILLGDDGNDIISGGAGNDVLTGGAGADSFNFAAGSGVDTITDFEIGVDKINLSGVFSNYNAVNSGQFFRLVEVAANGAEPAYLRIEISINGDGNFSEFLRLVGVTAAQFNWNDLNVDGVMVQPPPPPPPALFDNDANTVDFNNVQAGTYEAGSQYNAGAGDDIVTLANDAAAAQAAGYVPGTAFHGGDGSDTINGGDMDDVIHGDNGDDYISGGAGNDTIYGGNDNSHDELDGGAGDDTIYGGGGSDYITGSDGNDTIYGGAGDDNALYGDAGNDRIYGEDGDDVLIGDLGDDVLDGGDGNDQLAGGAGIDDMTGGAGSDAFVFSQANEGGDRIRDFETGVDSIKLEFTIPGMDPSDLAALHNYIRIVEVAASGNMPAGLMIQINADGMGFVDYLRLDGVSLQNGTFNWNDIVYNGILLDTPPAHVDALFTDATDNVDFNSIVAGSYIDGTQYNAGDGNDTVTLADSTDAATNAGYDPSRTFDAGAGDDTIIGRSLDDTINGNAGNDTLSGNDGNDTIYGGSGNDQISGGKGEDYLDGGIGADVIHGNDGSDIIVGGADNDILFGDADDDIIDGGDGADEIYGGSGNDVLTGGNGADKFFFNFNADGVDVITDFTTDVDKIHISAAVLPGFNPGVSVLDDFIRLVEIDNGDGTFSTMVKIAVAGQGFVDYIRLEGVSLDSGNFQWSDILFNGIALSPDAPQLQPLFTAGDDTINFNSVVAGSYINGSQYNAGDGNDTVTLASNMTEANEAGYDPTQAFNAGAGNDTVTGGTLNDIINGGDGDDRINGGAGNDILDGGQGVDLIDGGNGDDTIMYSNDITFQLTTDYLTGAAMAAKDYALSTDVFRGGAGFDTLMGTSGNDYIVLDDDDGSGGHFMPSPIEGEPRLQFIEAIDTGDGDDIVDLTSFVFGYGDIHIIAGAGRDYIFSNDGNDTLDGGTGNDVIYGGNGNDTIIGGAGVDELYGENGDDTFQLVADGTWGANADALYQGKILSNDIFDGGDGVDTLLGTSGNDVFVIDAYNGYTDPNQIDQSIREYQLINNIEIIRTGDGNDVVDLYSTFFTMGNVEIDGGNGDDFLYASTGDDRIIGGAGSDIMSGDVGADTFVYQNASEGAADEVILDFQTGTDKLELSNILTGYDGSNLANFVRFVDGADFTTVQIDVDGSANGQNWVSLVKLDGVTSADGGVNLSDILVS